MGRPHTVRNSTFNLLLLLQIHLRLTVLLSPHPLQTRAVRIMESLIFIRMEVRAAVKSGWMVQEEEMVLELQICRYIIGDKCFPVYK